VAIAGGLDAALVGPETNLLTGPVERSERGHKVRL